MNQGQGEMMFEVWAAYEYYHRISETCRLHIGT